MAAKARLGRIKTSAATNPTYELSDLGSQFTFGESVAYVLFMGDRTTGTANRSWVEWLFGECAFTSLNVSLSSDGGVDVVVNSVANGRV
jgi:hypothetical protein